MAAVMRGRCSLSSRMPSTALRAFFAALRCSTAAFQMSISVGGRAWMLRNNGTSTGVSSNMARSASRTSHHTTSGSSTLANWNQKPLSG
jgi:hypothetical protein